MSLLWAYGKLTQLQQQQHKATCGTQTAADNRRSRSSTGSTSLRTHQQFVSMLCNHITHLIQLSNNTADGANAAAASLNPGSSSDLTEPWHPDDLTDSITGLAAAASSAPATFKSQSAACLLDASAHEVYRQLSNRHSTAGSFTVESLVALLQAYCKLDYKDGEHALLLLQLQQLYWRLLLCAVPYSKCSSCKDVAYERWPGEVVISSICWNACPSFSTHPLYLPTRHCSSF